NFIAEKPVFQASVERKQSGIVQIGIRGALLEVERKQRETPDAAFLLVQAPGKTEHLKKLEAVFRSETVVGQQRIGQVEFLDVNAGVQSVGKQRRQHPLRLCLPAFVAQQRSEDLRATTRRKSQPELVSQRAAFQAGR